MQVKAIYSGRVQGVGFRYTVYRYASHSGLTGWVQNRSSGDVEMLAEGKKSDLVELLKSIEEYFAGNIKDKQIQFIDAANEYSNFKITF